MISQRNIVRREFLQRSGRFGGGLMLASALSAFVLAAGGKRLKVAAIITAFTYRSHAHVILEILSVATCSMANELKLSKEQY